MAQASEDYVSNQENVVLCGTDLEDRGFDSGSWNLTYGEDFLTNDYKYDKVDIIIMNPPYAIYEDFVKKALERATDKLIVLGRTQALEGISRYNNIYINNPPTAVYQYIDRIQCWKGGVKPAGTGAQAYAWFVWDKKKKVTHPELHWIKRDNSY
jgi:hypothetical protein